MKAVAQELLYPTVLKSPGPWLIDTKDVLTLDELFDQIMGDIGLGETNRALKIFLPKGHELKTTSFKEAMSHVGSQEEIATGFEYELGTKINTVSIRLVPPSKREKDEGEHSHALDIRVSPQGSSASQNIMGLLKAWVADVQPPWWQRWLLAPRQLSRLFLFLVLIFGSLSLFSTAPSPSDYKESYKQQARELLRNGIDQRNQAKALELILSLESGFIPPGAKVKHSQKSFVTFFVAVFVLAVLSATPSMCLGIWRGKQRLRLWRLWFRLNFYTIPSLILTTIFWPQLVSVIESALRP
jgi:hypothetical protein